MHHYQIGISLYVDCEDTNAVCTYFQMKDGTSNETGKYILTGYWTLPYSTATKSGYT